MKAVPMKWVFKKKTNAEGKVCRYKAILVCKGFMQREGVDFVESFAPVAKFQSITCLIAIAVYYGLKLEQMHMVTAFLSPDMEEEIYIQFLQGLEVPEEIKKGAPALRLLKGLYGLKQAPRLWNDAVNATLHRLNLTRCNSDPCLFVRKEKSEFVIIALYDDDLVVTSNSDLLSKVKVALKENYKMTDLGELSWCLGIQVAQYQASVRLTQWTYILKMLERFGMQDCKPCKTPAAVHFKKDCLSAGQSLSEEDTQKYQSIIGSLMHAVIGTRPDIPFVLSDLSKYVSKPGKNNLVASKLQRMTWFRLEQRYQYSVPLLPSSCQAHLLPY
jgi:hypothetical protein